METESNVPVEDSSDDSSSSSSDDEDSSISDDESEPENDQNSGDLEDLMRATSMVDKFKDDTFLNVWSLYHNFCKF